MFTAGAKQIVYRKNKDCPNCRKLKRNKFKRNTEIVTITKIVTLTQLITLFLASR